MYYECCQGEPQEVDPPSRGKGSVMSRNVITKSITKSSVRAFWVENGEVKGGVIATVPYNITDSAARTLVKRSTGNPNAGVDVQKERVTYEIDADVFFKYARVTEDAENSCEE